jgi:SAM-dependent methyltransferase
MFTSRDRVKCQELLRKYYSGRKFHDSLYRDLILKHVRAGSRILDAGCGRYMSFCKDLSGIAVTFGADLEPTLDTDNRQAPFGVRADAGRLPYAAESFDMVISRSVVEHLEDPPAVFREFHRILRPGGSVVLITPNKYDYVSLIAAATPCWLHKALVSRIFQISEDDVFPTLYRANTGRALRRAMRSAGLVEKELLMINHYPAYLMFSPLLFRLGVLYERLTSREALRQLRGSILCVFEKQARTQPSGAADHAPRYKAGIGVV